MHYVSGTGRIWYEGDMCHTGHLAYAAYISHAGVFPFFGSGALRIGAYRDFHPTHPTQISTYSFWPFKPVCIIHYTFLQCAVCTELLWSLQLWARLAQSAARGVGLIWPKLWRRAVAQIMFMSIIFQPGSVTHPNPANQRPREQAATNQGAS